MSKIKKIYILRWKHEEKKSKYLLFFKENNRGNASLNNIKLSDIYQQNSIN